MPNGCNDDLLPWRRTAENILDTKYPYGEARCVFCPAHGMALVRAYARDGQASVFLPVKKTNPVKLASFPPPLPLNSKRSRGVEVGPSGWAGTALQVAGDLCKCSPGNVTVK